MVVGIRCLRLIHPRLQVFIRLISLIQFLLMSAMVLSGNFDIILDRVSCTLLRQFCQFCHICHTTRAV